MSYVHLRLGESAKCIASVSVSLFSSLSYTDTQILYTFRVGVCTGGEVLLHLNHVYIYGILLSVFGI